MQSPTPLGIGIGFLILAISLWCSSLESPSDPKFEEWCRVYGKHYSAEQHIYRQAIFTGHAREIEQHNILYSLGKSSYSRKLNRFSDRTSEEWLARSSARLAPRSHSLFREAPSVRLTGTCTGAVMQSPNPPKSLDWSLKLATPVVDRGDCGRDWAIVAAEAMEGLYALKSGSLVGLSSQQLVDCSGDYGNEGCSGGFMDQAFWYIIDNGIANNKSYPFRESSDQGRCKYTSNMRFTGIGRCARVESGNYIKALSAVVQQPVSVAISTHKDMQHYHQGVYDGECSQDVDKGMLLLGYGQYTPEDTPEDTLSDEPVLFWKLKNSDSSDWGVSGYLLLKRTEEDGPGKCGVLLLASVPQFLN